MPHVLAGKLVLVAFLANLPLGLWRASVRKFSAAWFIAIHLSIPFIILFRIEMGLGLYYIPFGIAAAVAGQMLGGYGKKLPFKGSTGKRKAAK